MSAKGTPWFKLHSILARDPKTGELMDALDLDRPTAVGHVVLVWCWICDHYPDGFIGETSPRRIEEAAFWLGERERFVDAMVQVGFFDRETRTAKGNSGQTAKVISAHNWMEYAGSYGRAQARQAQRQRKAPEKPTDSQKTLSCDSHATVATESHDRRVTVARRGEETEKRGDREDIKSVSRDSRATIKKPAGWTDELETEFEAYCAAYREGRHRARTPGHNTSGAKVRCAFRDRRGEGYSLDDLCNAARGLFRDAWRKANPNAQALEHALRAKTLPGLIAAGRGEAPKPAADRLQGSSWAEDRPQTGTRARAVTL